MAESSPRFNFDDFDAQIAEALADNDLAMRGIRAPGQIGGVAVRFSDRLQGEIDEPEIAIATDETQAV